MDGISYTRASLSKSVANDEISIHQRLGDILNLILNVDTRTTMNKKVSKSFPT
jgi:hypothetical protein